MRKNIKRVNKPRPVVSIVILTCPGRKRGLFRCLASVVSSDYQDYEIVLVTNGCQPKLIEETKNKFPQIRLIQLPTNTGVFGFNVGFVNAKGQYLLALDDDTRIKPETIDKFVKAFQKQSKKVGIISPNAYNPKINHYYSPPDAKEPMSFHGSSAFRKEVFEKIGYYDAHFEGPMFEDDFALRAVNAGFKIHFGKDIVIDHFEKTGFRKKQVFLNARNKVWLNIKHFSLKFFPFLIGRDLVWLFLLPYRKGSLKALYYGLSGYLLGWLSFPTPLRKRKVVSDKIQKRFLKNYLFSDLKRLVK